MTFDRNRRRALALDAAILGLFAAAAIATTWPLALHLDRAISDPGDPFFTTFTLAWDWHALTHGLPLFDAPLFHPDRHALAFSEHMLGLSIALAPLFALGVAPLTIHNLGVIVAFIANAWCLFLLARYATRSTPAAILSGLAFAFLGARVQHLPHLHFLWAGWLPLTLLFLLRLRDEPSRRNAWALGIALVMNGLSSMHWLVFGAVALGLTIVVLVASHGAARTPEFLRRLAIALVASALLLLPSVLPYLRVAREYGMERRVEETLENSAEWSDWLVPILQSRAYGARASIAEQECAFFPGFVIATLAAIGLFAALRRRPPPALVAAILWLVVGAMGARGVHGWFGAALFRYVMPFRGIRVPARWVTIADIGLCLLAAHGAAEILARRGRLPRAIATMLLCATLLVELRVAPIRWYLVPLDARPVDAVIATLPIAGGVLELPMTQEAAYEYLWRATQHRRPLVNGVSSYTPPGYRELEAGYETLSPAFLQTLIARRCSLVVVHEGALRAKSAAIRAWLRRELDAGNLTFVGRFDAGTRPDWLFAVNAIEPASSTWRAPAQRDVAGRTPDENLALFVDRGDWTYTAQPFVSVDTPVVGTIRGPLTVSGWALAPAGVSEVVLHFENNRIAVSAERTDRGDVQALLPWYPKTRMAGFRATFAAPPNGIRGATDLQLEVIDGAGHRRRNPPIWFHWRRALADPPVWNANALQPLLARLEAPSWSLARLQSGVSAIQDFCAPLVSHRVHESDAQFTERILVTLLGRPALPALRTRYLALLARGTPRDRVIEAVLTSDAFRGQYVTAGRVTIDQRITSEP